MPFGDEADNLEDLLPSYHRGCGWCEIELTAEYRYLDGLSYENINDVGVRNTLRAARGLCNHHAWRFVDVARDSLGLAIIYHDIIRTLIGEMRRLADGGDQLAPLRLLRRASQPLDLALGQTIRRLQPQASCPTCNAVMVALAERGHLGRGLCRPHLWLARARAPHDADLRRAWASTLERLRRRAVDSSPSRAPSRGTLLDLAEAAFGQRGIQQIPRRVRVRGTHPEPTAEMIKSIEQSLAGEGCPVCALVHREVVANLPTHGRTFPDDLDALVRQNKLCSVHAWLALDAAGGEAEARRYPLTRSAVDSLVRAGPASQEGDGCPLCDFQSGREAAYCLGLARLSDRPAAQSPRGEKPAAVACLPHLRLLLELAPPESAFAVVRSAVPTFQRLRQGLAEYIRKQDYRFRDEPRGTEQSAPLHALSLVAGARWFE